MTDIPGDDLLTLTADIVVAHVSFNKVDTDELTRLIGVVHTALGKLGGPAAEAQRADPAVPIAASVKPDHLVCLEDGVKLKMLKRHLASHHGITPAEYRAKWGLPHSYPMVAPNYAKTRQTIALQTGLGRKADTPIADVAEEPAAALPAAVEESIEVVESVPKPAAEPAPVEAAPEPRLAADALVPEAAEPAAPPRRRTLRPAFTPPPEPTPAPNPSEDASSVELLCNAVNSRTCVSAIYNKQHVVLAPHVVFTRHDEPFMRGIALQRDGKRPAALKLATFRLTGLVGLSATSKKFAPNDLFDPNDPEYEGATLAKV